MKQLRLVARLVLLALAPSMATSDIASTTQSLMAFLQASGKLSVPAAIALQPTSTGFAPFVGSLPLSFRVRTSPGAGGTISLQVSSDFTPPEGPSASGGNLRYTCTGSSMGNPCSGIQTASPSAQSPVVSLPGAACTGGGAPCSQADPNTVQVDFVLENEPAYNTGNYSAQVLFVISAT